MRCARGRLCVHRFPGGSGLCVGVMEKEYDIKNRGTLGPSKGDVKEIDILGRALKYTSAGMTWHADPRHRKMILERFGFNGQTKSVTKNGAKDERVEEGEEDLKSDVLQKEEEQAFRALAARACKLCSYRCS